MKLSKILSAVMAGVVAATVCVSELSVCAGAVSEKVIAKGTETSIYYFPQIINKNVLKLYAEEYKDFEGLLGGGKNGSCIIANLEENDIITVKVRFNGTEKTLQLGPNECPGYNFDLWYSESGSSVKHIIDRANNCIKGDDWARENYTCSIDTLSYIKVFDANYILNGVDEFEYEVTITPGSSSDTVSASKPTAPTTLKATAKSATSVGLTWKSTGADSYNIYRSTSKTGTYKKIGTSTKASYTDKGLTKGKTYYYKVIAVSGGKESEFSKIASAKAAAPAPSTVKAVKAKSGAAKITWKKSSGASGYEIYMSTSADSGFKKIKTAGAKSAASYTKTGLKSGQTYYFKIRTYTGVNGKRVYSGFSKTVKVTV